MADSVIDNVSGWMVDRYAYVKARLKKTAPGYIGAEVSAQKMGLYSSSDEFNQWLSGLSQEKLQKLYLTISWIYSSIEIIARETSSTPAHVRQRINDRKSVDVSRHPFELLIEHPNDFMTKTFLMRYTIYWLSLSDRGAFWFLAPDADDENKINEIWPIHSEKIEPIKDANHYVKHFRYTTGHEESRKSYKIPAKYIIWFRYPDPMDYWASLPPLRAALLPGEIDLAISGNQKKFYTEGRGLPLSLVSLDPSISDPDFEAVKADIKSDWSNSGASIAVARGGMFDVKSLGFTQKDLEIIASQEMTRDRISTIFFGYPILTSNLVSGEGLKQIDKWIKEKTVYPLHVLMAEQITLQGLHPFFDQDLSFVFDDVRTADRALTIQEKNIDSRWMTVNQMRAKSGDDDIDIPQLPGYGDLPVGLANNPSFVSLIYGLNMSAAVGADEDGIDGGKVENAPEVGNLPQSQDSLSVTNQLARGDTRPSRMVENIRSFDAVYKEAFKGELKKMKTVYRRGLEREGNPLNRDFASDIIDDEMMDAIKSDIKDISDVDVLNEYFSELIEGIDDTSGI